VKAPHLLALTAALAVTSTAGLRPRTLKRNTDRRSRRRDQLAKLARKRSRGSRRKR